MKLLRDSYSMFAALFGVVCLSWSCRNDDPGWGGSVEIGMRIGADNVIGVRAFGNDDPLSVDRILVIPFIKSDALPESDANYTAATEMATQIDVDQFPTDVTLLLSPLSTCKLVVLGFNRQNYDFYNSDPLAGDIVIDYDGSLSDLTVEDRAAGNNSPQTAELFFDISNSFRPGGGTTVSATLTRMVGGISVTLTNVPDGVGMRLYHTSDLTTRWRVAGLAAAGSFTQTGYYPLADQGGGVSYYSRYYFPTGDTYVTMDLQAVEISTGDQIQRVPVATSSGGNFSLTANQAINLSGDYRSVILGQELFVANPSNNGLNIDDDNWDGVDDTPESDPEPNP